MAEPERIMPSSEIAETYTEVLNLAFDADNLRSEAAALDRQRSEVVAGFKNEVQGLVFPEDEHRFMAAAILRGTETAEQLDANVDILRAIDKRIKESKGQVVMWFSPEPEFMPLITFPDELRRYVYMGIFSNNASLEVDSKGKVSAPLMISAKAELDHMVEEAEHPMRGAVIRLFSEEYDRESAGHQPELTIEEQDISKAVIYIGDQEVDEAINHAYENHQSGFKWLRDQVRAEIIF